MTDHIFIGKHTDTDIINIFNDLKRHIQTGTLAGRQVLLTQVAGNDYF